LPERRGGAEAGGACAAAGEMRAREARPGEQRLMRSQEGPRAARSSGRGAEACGVAKVVETGRCRGSAEAAQSGRLERLGRAQRAWARQRSEPAQRAAAAADADGSGTGGCGSGKRRAFRGRRRGRSVQNRERARHRSSLAAQRSGSQERRRGVTPCNCAARNALAPRGQMRSARRRSLLLGAAAAAMPLRKP
jgi:hypothetical protein